MNRTGIRVLIPTLSLLVLATVVVTVTVAQEPVIEMDPERATAVVAPVEVTLGGLPQLDPLPLAESVLEAEVVRTELVAVPLPVPSIPRETIEEAITITGEQVFFNATLGAGSVNSVLGNINVYRIGDGPEFRISYDHRASDGFNFQEPGSGFFRQENQLETWLRLGDDQGLGFELELGYGDERFGLQGKPKYYSAETRVLNADLSARYRWDARSSTTLSLGLEDLSRVLAVSTAGGDQEAPLESRRERYYHVAPVLSARFEWPRLILDTKMDYSGRFTGGVDMRSSSTGGVSLRIEGVPVDGLTLKGIGASRYRLDDRPYFPVEAGLEYSFRDSWTFQVSGGYRVEERSPGELWRDYPVATVPDGQREAPPVDQILFADGDFTLNILSGTTQLSAGGGWYSHSDRLRAGDYDSELAEYPVDLTSLERLVSRVGISLTPTDGFRTSLEWRGEWFDRETGAPEQVLGFNVRSDWDRLIGEVTAEAPIDRGGFVVPRVGGSLRYGLARDVELKVFLTDVLGPLEDKGRTRRGLAPSEEDPFLEPGFEAGASIRVSF